MENPNTSPGALTPSFLGNVIEICIVTNDHHRTLGALTNLGIGPWRIYTCSPTNCHDQTYCGQPNPFTIRLCFAPLSPNSDIVYEVIQPISGPTIFQDWLDKQGGVEGVHHVAYDCGGLAWEDRLEGFRKRGFEAVQSGDWRGENRFAFFESEAAGTCFETIAFVEGWEYPEPEEWFPPLREESEVREVEER